MYILASYPAKYLFLSSPTHIILTHAHTVIYIYIIYIYIYILASYPAKYLFLSSSSNF